MKRYFIQDTRQVVGNCAVWWAAGGHGYTTEIAGAGLFDEDFAKHLRSTDRAFLESEIMPLVSMHVRVEHLPK